MKLAVAGLGLALRVGRPSCEGRGLKLYMLSIILSTSDVAPHARGVD